MREGIEGMTYVGTEEKTSAKRRSKLFFGMNVLLLVSFIACTVSAFLADNSSNEEASRFHAIMGSVFSVVAFTHLVGKAKYYFTRYK